jgi:hypothetical protein
LASYFLSGSSVLLRILNSRTVKLVCGKTGELLRKCKTCGFSPGF